MLNNRGEQIMSWSVWYSQVLELCSSQKEKAILKKSGKTLFSFFEKKIDPRSAAEFFKSTI